MKLFFLSLLFTLISLQANAMGSKPAPPPRQAPDPVDVEIAKLKPSPGDSALQAKAKCQKLSDSRRNIDLLLIGFEGLGGYDPDAASLVYRYHYRVLRGMPAVTPEWGTSAPVLHRIFLPLVLRHTKSMEVLNFPETIIGSSAGSLPEICAAIWMERRDFTESRGRKVVIMGHSYGGYSANLLSNALKQRGIPVDQVYSIDPIPRSLGWTMHKSSNVRLWNNFYQRNQTFRQGHVVSGAELNSNLSYLGVKHGNIVRTPLILERIERQLGLD